MFKGQTFPQPQLFCAKNILPHFFRNFKLIFILHKALERLLSVQNRNKAASGSDKDDIIYILKVMTYIDNLLIIITFCVRFDLFMIKTFILLISLTSPFFFSLFYFTPSQTYQAFKSPYPTCPHHFLFSPHPCHK